MAVNINNERINVKLPKDTKTELSRIAKEDNRSLSNFLGKIIKDYCIKNNINWND